MDWHIVLTIASIMTAVGVIIGSTSKWGGAISKFISKVGWKKMNAMDLEGNIVWKEHQEYSKQMMKAITSLGEKLDVLHQDLRKSIDEDTKLILKLELKDLFLNHPERIDAIENAYGHYHNLHGNSYIEELHEEWRENYLSKAVEKEVNKRS